VLFFTFVRHFLAAFRSSRESRRVTGVQNSIHATSAKYLIKVGLEHACAAIVCSRLTAAVNARYAPIY
jgi:hypothetical protein